MKRIAGGLLALLLLVGCGGAEEQTDTLLLQYSRMESCHMEAVVKCEYEGELKEYTLRCEYVPEGASTVTVLAPTHLEGLSAVFDGEDCSLCYEDFVLDAGTLGESRISPAEVLPCLMDAMRTGYPLEQSREEQEGENLLRLTMEMEEQGVKQYWTVWLKEDGAPLRAEVTENEKLIFRLEFTAFTFGAILIEE